MTPETASDIAVSGLQYLAGDTEQLSRFIALTGITPQDMREQAHSPEFMAAVLDYYLGNEPTLLAFATSCDHKPEDVAKARYTLVPPDVVDGWE
ncbi:MAG: DUF3572 domain-containing protein [Pseudomonadota bacterium]